MYNPSDYSQKPSQQEGILIDLSDGTPPPVVQPVVQPLPPPPPVQPSWNQYPPHDYNNYRQPPIYPVYSEPPLYPTLPEPVPDPKPYVPPNMPTYNPPKPPSIPEKPPYGNGPYGSRSYETPKPPVKNDDVYYDTPPEMGPYGTDNKPTSIVSYSSTTYSKEIGNPICIKYDVTEEQLIQMRGRTQLILIDDGYSNITEAFAEEQRSSQIADACKMLVEFNGVHNSFPTKIHLVNAFYLDNETIYNENDYNEWLKNLEWTGGTIVGDRLNAILESYFKEWNRSSDTLPITITYIGDSPIKEMKKFMACIVNAVQETEKRCKPRQIIFQIFQVGNDTSTTINFQQIESEIKTKYKVKGDIVECYFGPLNLMQKIKKALVGEIISNYQGPYNNTTQYDTGKYPYPKGPY
jgi:hypothetical protein